MGNLLPQYLDFYSFTGGMDTISSSVQIGREKFRDVQNVNYYPLGGFSWRKGYIKLNSSAVSANTCNGIYMARFSNGTNNALLVCGGKLYSMTSLNGTWVDKTNSLTISSSQNFPVSFAVLNDIVCMSNDNDSSWQVNSALTAQVIQGSPVFTSALFNLEYRGYMFWGQTVESATRQYDRLRFSDINNPNAFTMLGANNFIDVASKNGGDLRGAVSYNGYLYCFKRRGIYQIAFNPTQVNSSGTIFPFSNNATPVVPNVGTQSHRSIVKFTTPITNSRQSGVELVFFVDQFGIPRIFDGQTTVQVGYPISQSRDTTITSLSSQDSTMLPYIWAVNKPDRNQIWCFVSSANSKFDTCWVFDYSVGFVFGRHSFATTFACGDVFEKTNGTWQVFTGDYAGIVYEHDSGQTDNGTAISSYVVCGDAFNQSPIVSSKWRFIEVKGQTGSSGQTITISVYPDGADSVNSSFTVTTTLATSQTLWGASQPMTWGTSLWAKAGVISAQKELGLDAKTLRVKISNAISGNTATIEGFTLGAYPNGESQT